MAFFDELGKKARDVAYVAADKARDVASVAADKAKDAAELTKISVAIAGEQREMDKNYRTIGEWFVSEYEGEIPDAVYRRSGGQQALLGQRRSGSGGRGSADEDLPHLRRPVRQQVLPPVRCAHGRVISYRSAIPPG